jgi:hypothetical protein
MSDFAENVSGYPNPNGYPDAPGPSLTLTQNTLSLFVLNQRESPIHGIDSLLCVLNFFPRASSASFVLQKWFYSVSLHVVCLSKYKLNFGKLQKSNQCTGVINLHGIYMDTFLFLEKIFLKFQADLNCFSFYHF